MLANETDGSGLGLSSLSWRVGPSFFDGAPVTLEVTGVSAAGADEGWDSWGNGLGLSSMPIGTNTIIYQQYIGQEQVQFQQGASAESMVEVRGAGVGLTPF